LRTLRTEVRDVVVERLRQMLKGLEAAYGVVADLEVVNGYPLLENNPVVAEYAQKVASEVLGPNRVHVEPPRMGAEDFAYFLQRFPGVLIRLGCHDPEVGFQYGLHSPSFNIDERVLDIGVGLFVTLIERRYAET
jgi:metal-dependent amidase/aminoacylase/carboxypeptidase family protein